MNKSYLTIIYVLVLLTMGVSIFGGMKIIRKENFQHRYQILQN